MGDRDDIIGFRDGSPIRRHPDSTSQASSLSPEVCGLPGDSDVGYCVCIKPASHTEDPYSRHGCQHGAW